MLKKCKQILGSVNTQQESEKIDWRQLILKLFGIDPVVCPKCKNGLLLRVEQLIPVQIAAAPTWNIDWILNKNGLTKF